MKLKLANYSLLALALFYIIMLGGGNYEQLNITTLVTSDLPRSLYILQGDYGFKPFAFWILFRPLTILLFIAALAFNWRASQTRRTLIIIAFGIDILTSIATFAYFAPETETILSIPFESVTVDQILLNKAKLWSNLNWVRLGAFYAGSILLLFSILYPGNKINSDSTNP